MPSRGRIGVRAALAVDLVANTILELSPVLGRWSKSAGSSSGSHLPPVLRHIAAVRPETGDADVHAVMWFVAGLLVLAVVRTGRRRALALISLWAFATLLEALQPLLTRSAAWSDVVANAAGIAFAAGVVAVRGSSRRRTNMRQPWGRRSAVEGEGRTAFDLRDREHSRT